MAKKITEKRLENIALFYLQRYESCSSKLRDTLKRRVRRAKMQGIEVPDDANQWIENVVNKMRNKRSYAGCNSECHLYSHHHLKDLRQMHIRYH